MKPLADITKAIGAEKWVTISTIQPLLYKLLEKHLKPSSSNSSTEAALKKAIYLDLNKRYTGSAIGVLNKAAFLDSRFKSLLFLKPEDKKDIEHQMESDMLAILTTDSENPDECEPPPVKRHCGEDKLMKLSGDVINPTPQNQQDSVPACEKARTELAWYIGEDSTEKNPLE